ncbi:UbiX family flavin prenyltransferase [Salisediminibacterium selenitireducens]|uniref:Flavin prenyltransferase UbiX n=1 Tax=Bacillus selenitireducens (strain ATCC 700615 / DSM 15326 / MLS10) TaxID=439292 RepID=D6XX86_BACIE|nr:UbiX family flavin prenyltransferase [Salisediminibacterium selenitireducens]ADH97943.1 3-octaprenyl-4-hydroxybenzoate carboxy-lyase [[Bacillus] selenitireducens MLS10]
MTKRIIIGMSGSTGPIYGIRLLEVLRDLGVETHLILSQWGEKTITIETDYTVDEVKKLASYVHPATNQAAAISSGSFKTDGMVIVPCSMKTLSAVAHGYADNLVSRAADVVLKERRKLIMVPRETPLNDIHLENMLKLSRMGVVMMPPMPAFYNKPESIGDMVDHTVSRLLDQLDIDNSLTRRWLEKED